jgi:hypothetical protein
MALLRHVFASAILPLSLIIMSPDLSFAGDPDSEGAAVVASASPAVVRYFDPSPAYGPQVGAPPGDTYHYPRWYGRPGYRPYSYGGWRQPYGYGRGPYARSYPYAYASRDRYRYGYAPRRYDSYPGRAEAYPGWRLEWRPYWRPGTRADWRGGWRAYSGPYWPQGR